MSDSFSAREARQKNSTSRFARKKHYNALCSSLCGANGRKLNPLQQAININEGTPPQGVRRSNRNRGRNRADETSERRLAAILDPSNWDKKSNILINKWCQNINRLVHNAILTRNQPALAEVINSEVSNYIHGAMLFLADYQIIHDVY